MLGVSDHSKNIRPLKGHRPKQAVSSTEKVGKDNLMRYDDVVDIDFIQPILDPFLLFCSFIFNRYHWADACNQASTQSKSGKTACKYSNVLFLRFAIIPRNNTKDDSTYEFLSKAFHLFLLSEQYHNIQDRVPMIPTGFITRSLTINVQ